MTTKEKVNYYYRKLLEVKRSTIRNASIEYNSSKIKEIIVDIILSNNDHLLTSGFLYYLTMNTCGDEMSKKLSLILDKENLLKLYGDYIYETHQKDYIYYNLLTDSEKQIFDKYFEYLKLAHRCNGITRKDIRLIERILTIIGSYIFINQKDISEFDKYAIDYFDDYKNKLEEMELQGICYEIVDVCPREEKIIFDYNNLSKYLENKFDNEEKEIR